MGKLVIHLDLTLSSIEMMFPCPWVPGRLPGEASWMWNSNSIIGMEFFVDFSLFCGCRNCLLTFEFWGIAGDNHSTNVLLLFSVGDIKANLLLCHHFGARSLLNVFIFIFQV